MRARVYVCLCNSYRDSDIERVAKGRGICRAADAYGALGEPPVCGTCLTYAQDLIDGVLSRGNEPSASRHRADHGPC